MLFCLHSRCSYPYLTTKLMPPPVAITGQTSNGLGAATVLALAKNASPAHILLLARSIPKIQPVIDQIHAANPTIHVTPIVMDLSSQKSVKKAAAEIVRVVEKI